MPSRAVPLESPRPKKASPRSHKKGETAEGGSRDVRRAAATTPALTRGQRRTRSESEERESEGSETDADDDDRPLLAALRELAERHSLTEGDVGRFGDLEETATYIRALGLTDGDVDRLVGGRPVDLDVEDDQVCCCPRCGAPLDDYDAVCDCGRHETTERHVKPTYSVTFAVPPEPSRPAADLDDEPPRKIARTDYAYPRHQDAEAVFSAFRDASARFFSSR